MTSQLEPHIHHINLSVRLTPAHRHSTQVMTSKLPFEGLTAMQIVKKVCFENALPDMTLVIDGCPEVLTDMMTQCLAQVEFWMFTQIVHFGSMYRRNQRSPNSAFNCRKQ